MENSNSNNKCDVCGAAIKKAAGSTPFIACTFCGFSKDKAGLCDDNNNDLIYAKDINSFFKNKFSTLKNGETFELILPINRFYKKPKPRPGQINFFKSKNIMFLLEQHGFQMVSRKSRFSCELSLIVRKV